MNVLVIGCLGQLGRALQDTVPDDVVMAGVDVDEIDITNSKSVHAVITKAEPDVVINAAAYTAVDQAESEPLKAKAVNVDGVANVAMAAREVGARLIHVSTDFVYDGIQAKPYLPGATTNPLGVYGETKRQGELVALAESPDRTVVVRTAWLYGQYGGNFVKTMLQLMQQRDSLAVVADQVGTPTWAESLANVIWGITSLEQVAGIFHWTDGGQTSWYEFAQAIQDDAFDLNLLTKKIPIAPIPTDEYPTPARRPAYSVLDTSSTCELLQIQPEPWRDNLHRMLQRLGD